MREVMDGCKVCGKRMLTNRSPLIRRTCDACKAEQRRESQPQDSPCAARLNVTPSRRLWGCRDASSAAKPSRVPTG